MPVTLKKSKKWNSPMKYLNKVTLPKKEDKKEDVSNINIFVSSKKSSCEKPAQSWISITDVLNSPLFCPAVNDCILSWIDVVSNDIGNIIIAWSDNWAFLDENTINTLIENNTDITTLESRVTVLEGDSHVPAVINWNWIVTSVPSWVDNQTFQLWLNIWQLPSTDSNNQVVLWTDWKLYVAQTTISTSWFNFVNTIADRDAQTVSDWHITQVIAAINPNDNGFYIYDSATTSWIELIPNATVISVNGHTGVVVLIPSDLAYVATISWTPVTNVQEALDAIKDFLNNFDNNVADSITNSLAVQISHC